MQLKFDRKSVNRYDTYKTRKNVKTKVASNARVYHNVCIKLIHSDLTLRNKINKKMVIYDI